MNVVPLSIAGVLRVEPKVFADERGAFSELWRADRYQEHGITVSFVQDNVSFSKARVLRGLHFQKEPHGQGKLVSVLSGAVLDVAVDVRVGSPTFGQWVAAELNSDNRHQLYIPPGCAHGFCVTADHAVVSYKCTSLYNPTAEAGVRYDDPSLAIRWPVAEPLLSPKDAVLPRLAEIPEADLPRG